MLAIDSLARCINQPTPWLRTGLFAPTELNELAAQIEELPICDLPLVKAFDRANSADQFARRGAATQWVCEGAGCGNLRGHCTKTTLGEAVVRARAPLSARVAVARREPELRSAPALLSWLARLDAETERPYRDADAYVTRRPHTSASLGWHVDDVGQHGQNGRFGGAISGCHGLLRLHLGALGCPPYSRCPGRRARPQSRALAPLKVTSLRRV